MKEIKEKNSDTTPNRDIYLKKTVISQIQDSTEEEISFKEKIDRVFTTYGLSRFTTDLYNLLKHKIRIGFKYCEDTDIPIGASKFGGAPDLPITVEWPYWNDTPLSFLLQVDLYELNQIAKEFDVFQIKRIKLPEEDGFLYFFYDYHQDAWGDKPEDKGSWRVLYSKEKKKDLIRTPNPSKHENYTYRSHILHYYNDIALPIGGLHVESKLLNSFNFDPSEEDAFYKFIDDYIQLDKRWDAKWFFGYPVGIYNDDNEKLCERNLYNSNKKEEIQKWRLFLQLGEIENLDWGNGGYLQFWIKNMLESNFTKTYAIIESINTTMRFRKK